MKRPTITATGSTVAVLAALVAGLVLAVPGNAVSPGAEADTATPLHVHTPWPAPGEIVTAGPTTVTAWVAGDAEVADVELTVDGRDVAPRVAGRTEAGHRASADVDLEVGEHRLTLSAVDGEGRRVERAWSVVATDTSSRRLSGETRLHTAAAVSAATFPDDGAAPAAVLARADDFADALAGVPLAAALDGPLLLTERERLSPPVADELRRAVADGGTVVLLGGTAALTERVADDVEGLGLHPDRVAGTDRYDTAAAIAGRLPAGDRVVVASGTTFADALAVSAPAARDGVPILLTGPGQLPAATVAALSDLDPASAVVVGGAAAVSADVERELDRHVGHVERLGGADRFATAAAVLTAFYDAPAAVSLASGTAFPDALAGTRHAAANGQPVLLAAPGILPAPTADALARARPGHLDVYGGDAAVGDDVVAAAVRAVVDGVDVPRLLGSRPAARQTVPYLDAVVLDFDRAVDPAVSTVHVRLGDRELRGTVDATDGPSATLTFRPLDGEAAPPQDVLHEARITADVRTTAGERAHVARDFAYLSPDPWYATAEGVTLHLPSRDVEMIGFHESNHDGARQQWARDTATETLVMPSRSRGTGDRSAADIVANPDVPLVAPVTGRVLRAGTYTLYCRYSDQYLVIEPDGLPGWEVKLLHFRGLAVGAGDRVVAGETRVGSGPRVLPFESQVDDYSQPRDWPHVHVEVVDTSIPDRPSSGGGC